MAEYMVIVLDDEGEQFATFFSKYVDAENYRMNSEVSMGWYAEVYQRVETEYGKEYQLI